MIRKAAILFFVLFVILSNVFVVAAQEPVVRAILFYAPTCPYCHTVITEVLPPLIQTYGGAKEVLYIPPTPEEEEYGPSLVGIFGESLEILYVNTFTQLGQDLYQAAVEVYSIPEENQVVPIMIVADTLLIGGSEIPAKFPGIIEEGLVSGGYDWAPLPGLSEAIEKLVPAPTAIPTTEVLTQEAQASAEPSRVATESISSDLPPGESSKATVQPTESLEVPTESLLVTEISILDRIKLDLSGNLLAIIVLIGMVISVAMVSSRLVLPDEVEEKHEASWLIPVLCVLGIGVAAYLTYVEASGAKAACGPVGDCNAVQESEYSVLFGIIPVGVLGLVGYVAIILTWVFARFSGEPWNQRSKVALLGMSFLGTLFSIYLTFLEPFVIGATCVWCVTSAVIMTVLMWSTVGPASEAISQLRKVEEMGESADHSDQ